MEPNMSAAAQNGCKISVKYVYLKSESSFSHLIKPATKKKIRLFAWKCLEIRFISSFIHIEMWIGFPFALFPLSTSHSHSHLGSLEGKIRADNNLNSWNAAFYISRRQASVLVCVLTIYALLLTHAQKPINGNKQMRRRPSTEMKWSKRACVCVCLGAKYFRIKDKSLRSNWDSAVWLLELQRISHSIKSFCMQ